MEVLQVARRYSPKGAKSRRQNTRVFYMYVKKVVVSVRECKKMFLKMYGISDGRLERALKPQQAAGGSLHCDQRGRHEPGNKIKPVTADNIKVHIKSLPRYKSHYSRKDNPHWEFLSQSLSIKKILQHHQVGSIAKYSMNTLTYPLEDVWVNEVCTCTSHTFILSLSLTFSLSLSSPLLSLSLSLSPFLSQIHVKCATRWRSKLMLNLTNLAEDR